MFNKKLLKIKMIQQDDTARGLAKHLNINESTLWRKMSGDTDFLHDEIKQIKERYNLTSVEVETIFLS